MKKNLGVHFSDVAAGGSDSWQTPDDLFAKLNDVFRFTLDAAASLGNAKCKKYFTEEDDALKQSWAGHVAFLNPPYSKLKEFLSKAHDEAKHNGATVVCLIPSRTDTAAWHDYAARGEIRFIRGRVKFVQPGAAKQNSAPFPSALVVFRPRLNDVKL